MMEKELVIRPLTLNGRLIEGVTDAVYSLEVQVDGRILRSKSSTVGPNGRSHLWDARSELVWRFDRESFDRIKAHEPRICLTILMKGAQNMGFCSFDLREISWFDGADVFRRKRISISNKPVDLEFEYCLRNVDPSMSATTNTSSSDTSSEEAFASTIIDQDSIGIAVGPEHLLIGDNTDTEYTLHITLVSLFGTNILEAPVPRKSLYWVKYSVFGVDIETDTFQSLNVPKFQPIRDSFHIRSNPRDFERFMRRAPLRVHLYCRPSLRGGGDHSEQAILVGSTTLRFDALFEAKKSEFSVFAFDTQDPFRIRDPNTAMLPSIRVQLELEKADSPLSSPSLEQKTKDPKAVTPTQDQTCQTLFSEDSDTSSEDATKPVKTRNSTFKVSVLTVDLDPYDDDDDEYSCNYVKVGLRSGETFVCGNQEFAIDSYGQVDLSVVDNVEMSGVSAVSIECIDSKNKDVILARHFMTFSDKKLGDQKVSLLSRTGSVRGSALIRVAMDKKVVQQKEDHEESFATQNESIAHLESNPKETFSFRFTLKLSSIQAHENIVSSIYLMCNHPLFTNAKPFRTIPPIRVDRHAIRTIPHGIHTFTFTCSMQHLLHVADVEPFLIEIWHKDKYGNDARLAFCPFPWKRLVDAPEIYQVGREQFSSRQAAENRALAAPNRHYQVVKVQTAPFNLDMGSYGVGPHAMKTVATVGCECTLETSSTQTCADESTDASRVKSVAGTPTPAKLREESTPTPVSRAPQVFNVSPLKMKSEPPPVNAPETEDVTVERFEAWKTQWLKEWEIEIQIKEATRMAELEQEWAAREHERVASLKLAQEEFAVLEQRMHRAMTDAEKRERTLAQLEIDLQRAVDRKMADVEVLHRRTREESDHQIKLYKSQVHQLDEEVRQLRTALTTRNKRLEKVEEDYAAFREKVRQSPEAVLHREIARLEGVNADLQNRIIEERDRTSQEMLAKETIKAQLVQVTKELQRLERLENTRAERALDQLRLDYLAREERYILDGDREQLRNLKTELNELRTMSLRQPTMNTTPQPHEDEFKHPGEAPEVIRLRAERAELLESGVYKVNHPIIIQLDRHIQIATQLAQS